MHAYGTIDELNACLGVLLSDKNIPRQTAEQLAKIQGTLFSIGADLATPLHSKAKILRSKAEWATELEQWIDAMELELPPLTSFIFPSGSTVGSELHRARTVCRRAERWIVQLAEQESITPESTIYVNRLSDYLFVAARFVNKSLGVPERDVVIPKE
jgi:cob(I)alamin adenosyltransferase